MANVEYLDLNLLSALDVLLAEGSVTGAAKRMHLSASAMSRTLARLRVATGDPLLVLAGRSLVPTPHALALRDRVRELVHEARSVLRPSEQSFDPSVLAATFTIRASQSFMESVCGALVAAVRAMAPHVRLRFVPKPDKDLRSLREGIAELEIGVVGQRAPEVLTRLLYRDVFIGVARVGHPLLTGPLTTARFAACGQVGALTRGSNPEPVDAALHAKGLARDLVVTVPGYRDAMRVARTTDLVAVVPRSSVQDPFDGTPIMTGLAGFDLPVEIPAIAVSAMWHPRLDADPAHRWLRNAVFAFFEDGENDPAGTPPKPARTMSGSSASIIPRLDCSPRNSLRSPSRAGSNLE